MQKFKKAKVMSVLSAAAAVGMYGHVAHGVLLTQYYVTAEISTTSNFAAGTFTSVALTQNAPAISMTAGEYVQYGLADVLTNNAGTGPVTNPVSNDAWDKQNVKDGAPAAPTNLGLSGIAYSVFSTDANGSKLQPLAGTQFGTNPSNNQPDYTTTAVTPINPNLTSGQSNTAAGPTTFGGDVQNNNGDVGVNSPVFLGYNPGNVDTFGKTVLRN